MVDKEKQKEAVKRLAEALASNSNDTGTEARKSLYCNDIESIRFSVENLVEAYDNESFDACAFENLSPLRRYLGKQVFLLKRNRNNDAKIY